MTFFHLSRNCCPKFSSLNFFFQRFNQPNFMAKRQLNHEISWESAHLYIALLFYQFLWDGEEEGGGERIAKGGFAVNSGEQLIRLCGGPFLTLAAKRSVS